MRDCDVLACFKSIEQIPRGYNRIREELRGSALHSRDQMYNQRDVGYGLAADGFRAQIAVTELDPRIGVGLGHGLEARSLGVIAKMAPEIGITVRKKALDDMRAQESTSTCNQNFHPRTSG